MSQNKGIAVSGLVIGALAGGVPGAIIGGLIGAALQEYVDTTCPICRSKMLVQQQADGKFLSCNKCGHQEYRKNRPKL